jgi:group I intron endonuclease
MESNVAYIYLLTSPSGKHYVGQTWHYKIRMSIYKNINGGRIHQQPKIYNALKKYGPENFEYNMIDICYSQEELDDAEKYWIKFYNSIHNGYNCDLGGAYGKHTEETKIKIGNIKRGFKHTPEAKLKISEANKHRLYKKHTQITKDKISKSKLGKSPNRNYYDKNYHDKLSKRQEKYKYIILDPEKNIYETINLKQFCKQNNLIQSLMSQVANKQRTHHKNWTILQKIKLSENDIIK